MWENYFELRRVREEKNNWISNEIINLKLQSEGWVTINQYPKFEIYCWGAFFWSNNSRVKTKYHQRDSRKN